MDIKITSICSDHIDFISDEETVRVMQECLGNCWVEYDAWKKQNPSLSERSLIGKLSSDLKMKLFKIELKNG